MYIREKERKRERSEKEGRGTEKERWIQGDIQIEGERLGERRYKYIW